MKVVEGEGVYSPHLQAHNLSATQAVARVTPTGSPHAASPYQSAAALQSNPLYGTMPMRPHSTYDGDARSSPAAAFAKQQQQPFDRQVRK